MESFIISIKVMLVWIFLRNDGLSSSTWEVSFSVHSRIFLCECNKLSYRKYKTWRSYLNPIRITLGLKMYGKKFSQLILNWICLRNIIFPSVEYRNVQRKRDMQRFASLFPVVRFTFSAHRKFVRHSMENFHANKVVFLATGVNI